MAKGQTREKGKREKGKGESALREGFPTQATANPKGKNILLPSNFHFLLCLPHNLTLEIGTQKTQLITQHSFRVRGHYRE